MNSRVLLVAIAAATWIGGTSWGLVALERHARTPGATAPAAARWPAASRLRSPRGATLVIFAHPRCPCTRATLGELDRLVARTRGRLDVRVVFAVPAEDALSMQQGELWQRAASIPGVATIGDVEGVEAARFGALTSGDAFLYDECGALVFRGGITASRGHEGDNEGRAAIERFVLDGARPRGMTPVFGCSLVGAPARSER